MCASRYIVSLFVGLHTFSRLRIARLNAVVVVLCSFIRSIFLCNVVLCCVVDRCRVFRFIDLVRAEIVSRLWSKVSIIRVVNLLDNEA